MGIFDALFGGGQQTQAIGTLTPDQQAIISQITSAGAGPGGIGGLAETLSGLSATPRTAFQAADPELLQNALRGIDLQTQQGIAGALGSTERFSSGNRLLRGRLAQQGGLAKRGQFLDFQNRERLLEMQDLQNAFAQQLQASGQLSGLLTAPLGIRGQENIISQGGSGLAPLIGAGIGFGLAGPGGGLAGAGTGALFGSLLSQGVGGQ